jgi:peptide/nickel transport system permease protein
VSTLRRVAIGVLLITCVVSLAANFLASVSYEKQFREAIDQPPSHQFPLGTDELGRDRLSRLLYGIRISLLLAPAAALLSTLLSAILGGLGAYFGGIWDRLATFFIDLFLSLPWLFLLLTVRALLPLNVPPITSVIVTFTLLGLLGWAANARVVHASVRTFRDSDFVLQARASGCKRIRLLFIHLLPNLRPILLAQFWISIPVFILTEANLGLMGLGVSEPLPSWGNLLRELENYTAIAHNPWLLVPLISLVVVVSCFQFVLSEEESVA